jgi:hypothetical protein
MKPIPFTFALLCTSWLLMAGSARADTIALLPDGVLTPTERDAVRGAVRDAGHIVLEDQEVMAAVDNTRGVCAHDDVPCLARIVLLADADAVVSIARSGEIIDVVAVDANPRVGRATATSSTVASAVLEALASLSPPPAAPPAAPPPAPEAPAAEPPAPAPAPAPEPSRPSDPHVTVERTATSTPQTNEPPWALAGAGLAGAGLVALAAGGYAALLAGGSMQEAEAARFQDDAARLGDTANGQLWLSGSALAVGVGAMAGGAALIFVVGGEP